MIDGSQSPSGAARSSPKANASNFRSTPEML